MSVLSPNTKKDLIQLLTVGSGEFLEEVSLCGLGISLQGLDWLHDGVFLLPFDARVSAIVA